MKQKKPDKNVDGRAFLRYLCTCNNKNRKSEFFSGMALGLSEILQYELENAKDWAN